MTLRSPEAPDRSLPGAGVRVGAVFAAARPGHPVSGAQPARYQVSRAAPTRDAKPSSAEVHPGSPRGPRR